MNSVMTNLDSRHRSRRAASKLEGQQALRKCEDCPVRQLSVCSSLNREECLALAATGVTVKLSGRSELFREGDVVEGVYNVTAGLLRTFRILPDGRRSVIGFVLPGDFIDTSLCERHDFCADAAGETVVCSFDRRAFWNFVAQRPSFMREIHESCLRQLALAHDQIALGASGNAGQKLACFLVGLQRRWGRLGGPSAFVPLPMTRQDIGDFLNLSIWTVSRKLAEFARDRRILLVPGGVRILPSSGLEQAMAGGD